MAKHRVRALLKKELKKLEQAMRQANPGATGAPGWIKRRAGP